MITLNDFVPLGARDDDVNGILFTILNDGDVTWKETAVTQNLGINDDDDDVYFYTYAELWRQCDNYIPHHVKEESEVTLPQSPVL